VREIWSNNFRIALIVELKSLPAELSADLK